MIDVAISGSDVPTATTVAAITISEIPNCRASPTADVTSRFPPTTSVAIPSAIQPNCCARTCCDGPTWIDAETLALHGKQLPPEFLYGAGVRVSRGTGAPAQGASDGEKEICIILHANRDAEFAARLRLDLMANGVRCWFLPEDISWSGIDLERPPYDRLVVVCSRNALESRPLVAEVKAALEREDGEQRECVLAVRVDDYLYDEWQHAQKDALLRKEVGDFRNWRDADLYRSALDHLLDALRNSP
jgi:hypothetical protein